jgi:thiamine pyrophosphokinase
MSRAVLFANGTITDTTAAARLLQPDDFLIAADGGAHYALSFGRTPHILIGDLDSVTPTDRAAMVQAGTRVVAFPPEKDATDLELAIVWAIDQGYRELVIVGALGGRTDQALGNLALLALASEKGAQARVDDGREEALLILDHTSFNGAPGDMVSLIPWGAPVEGIVTVGLRYPLSDETLWPDRTRGISNSMTGTSAEISIQKGKLLCVHSRTE